MKKNKEKWWVICFVCGDEIIVKAKTLNEAIRRAWGNKNGLSFIEFHLGPYELKKQAHCDIKKLEGKI